MLPDVTIDRRLDPGVYPLTEVVEGLKDSKGLRDLLGEDLEAFLASAEVEVVDRRGYMWVHGTKGRLMVSKWHLLGADERVLYLDFVHELVHVKQFREGADLYDDGYDYVDRPTEIEAYKVTVEEARDLGLEEGWLAEYLRVEWIDEEDHRKLLDHVGLGGDAATD